jgi:virginiamycin A acetyltransferase
MTGTPDPTQRYPLGGETSLVFLNTIVTNPQIEIGDYTYYHDFDDPLGFERNVRYLFPFENDRLVIGRFCAIGHGATFIMNGGNHRTDGLSTYPFGIFGGDWAKAMPESWPSRGDLVIGHDVWIGYAATLLAGITVGHGAVIGAASVVASDVPPFAIVAGNPARVLSYRHPPATIDRLLQLAWWDWPIDHITRHVDRIAAGDIDALAAIAPADPRPKPTAPT